MIIIDGPDGIGKTSVAKRIAEELNLPYIHHPTGDTSLSRDLFSLFKSHRDELSDTQSTFLMMAIWEESCNQLTRGGVFDRSPLSTIAYHDMCTQDCSDCIS